MSNEISETKQATAEDEQIASILENLPTETEISVDVPSKGKPYFNGKEGLVTIRPIKFGDEKDIATGGRGADFNPANLLLNKCLLNVEAEDLLLVDKLYLLLKIREISYGNDYLVPVACSHCSYENKLTLELNQLEVVPLPNDLEVFNMPVELKGIKKDAVVTAPLVSEEKYLYSDNLQKDLWRFVKSIDGNTSRAVISKVIPQLPVADVHRLINALSLSDYGVMPQIRYTCDSCKNTNLIALPIDENFFSVT
jgi:hypothetical protein